MQRRGDFNQPLARGVADLAIGDDHVEDVRQQTLGVGQIGGSVLGKVQHLDEALQVLPPAAADLLGGGQVRGAAVTVSCPST